MRADPSHAKAKLGRRDCATAGVVNGHRACAALALGHAGDVIFDLRPPGGRRHQHLSVEQERERLAPFAERAHAGGMLTVTEIQQAHQRQVGQEVALDDQPAARAPRLAQVTPRPRHPKADLTAQAAFKNEVHARPSRHRCPSGL